MSEREQAAPGVEPGVSAHRLRALIVSVALAALGYLAFALWGGWHEVAAAVVQVGFAGWAVLLGLSALNYVLRFLRWQVYLAQLKARVPWRSSLAIYLAGFALTTTPGKAGELIRSLFLRGHGVRPVDSVAAFVSERLSDLVAIVLLASIGFSSHPEMRPLLYAGMAVSAVVLLLVGSRRALDAVHRRAQARGSRLLQRVAGTLQAAAVCQRPRVMLPMTALSVLAWGLEATALHLLLGWLGMPQDWTFSFFVYAVGMLAGALSFLPGGLGGTEAAMVGLLLLAGHPQAQAVAAVVVIRITTLWFAVAIGLLALPVAPRGPRAAALPLGALGSGGPR